MSLYFVGIIAALLAAFFHAWANILDSYFSNKVFQRLATLIFTSSIISLVFIPVIALFSKPSLISGNILAITFIIALIEILYQYPYYWSLRRTDTSIVTSLFSLGKIVAPILAFFLVGERLNLTQYFGFFLIIIASTFLTFDLKKLKLNTSFLLMLIASLLLTTQSVLYKYAFDLGASFGSVYVWSTLFGVVIAGSMMCTRDNIKDIKDSTQKIKKLGLLFLLTQLLSWLGEVAASYSIFLIPVSIEKGITSTQPLIVLIIALIFAHKAPQIFKEYLGKDDIWKKSLFFILIIVGTVLVTIG